MNLENIKIDSILGGTIYVDGKKVDGFTPISFTMDTMSDKEIVPMSIEVNGESYYEYSGSFTCNPDFINQELLNDVLLNNSNKAINKFELYVPYKIQARKHKKWRINKKWLKKYGMRDALVKLPGTASVDSYDAETNNFTITLE